MIEYESGVKLSIKVSHKELLTIKINNFYFYTNYLNRSIVEKDGSNILERNIQKSSVFHYNFLNTNLLHIEELKNKTHYFYGTRVIINNSSLSKISLFCEINDMINKEKYKNNIELEIEPSDEIEVNNNIEKVRITPKIDLFIRKKPQFVKHEQCKSRNLCSNNNNK